MATHERIEETASYKFEQTVPINPELMRLVSRQVHSLEATNRIHQLISISPELIQLGSQIRLQLELFTVRTFLRFAHIYLGEDNNARYPRLSKTTIPSSLSSLDEAGLNQFYSRSKGRKNISTDLYRARLLVFMASRISDLYSQGTRDPRVSTILPNIYLNQELGLTIKHQFTIFEWTPPHHLSIIKSRDFLFIDDNSQGDGMLRRTQLLTPLETQGQLLTHAHSEEAKQTILQDQVLSHNGKFGSVCMSRHRISVDPDHPKGKHVLIFDPLVLHQAGYPLMTIDEGGKYGLMNDGQIIQELRFGLPIPIFLASAIMQAAYFVSQEAQPVKVRTFENPSTGDILPTPGTYAYGIDALSQLARQIHPT